MKSPSVFSGKMDGAEKEVKKRKDYCGQQEAVKKKGKKHKKRKEDLPHPNPKSKRAKNQKMTHEKSMVQQIHTKVILSTFKTIKQCVANSHPLPN